MFLDVQFMRRDHNFFSRRRSNLQRKFSSRILPNPIQQITSFIQLLIALLSSFPKSRKTSRDRHVNKVGRLPLPLKIQKGEGGDCSKTVCLNHQASVSPIKTSQLAPFIGGRIPAANGRRWKSRRHRAHLLFLLHCLSTCTQLQQSDVLILRKMHQRTLHIDKYCSTPPSFAGRIEWALERTQVKCAVSIRSQSILSVQSGNYQA
ncbi:hypothetical protein CDAR_39361 [Caerostris darwini]|uniref:Uncharacterized protein n=1 Tax=Caerostris darwini TaxID=1538125 RepID=A0AAV4U694_9ARAC|nr:hypothetical protein CDAR_39361 [Caerostris darwini]